MKAAAYTRYGPPDVVQIMEVEKPVQRTTKLMARVLTRQVRPSRMRGWRYGYNELRHTLIQSTMRDLSLK
jgi:hypothetical protein